MILALLCIYFVSRPLLKSHSNLTVKTELRDLVEEKERALASLRELEFDFQTGKIQEKEHRDLRAVLESKAIEMIQKIDATHKKYTSLNDNAISKQLEQEISALVLSQNSAGNQTTTDLSIKCCNKCGTTGNINDRYCAQCGRLYEMMN